jgi:hypothetical protein
MEFDPFYIDSERTNEDVEKNISIMLSHSKKNALSVVSRPIITLFESIDPGSNYITFLTFLMAPIDFVENKVMKIVRTIDATPEMVATGLSSLGIKPKTLDKLTIFRLCCMISEIGWKPTVNDKDAITRISRSIFDSKTYGNLVKPLKFYAIVNGVEFPSIALDQLNIETIKDMMIMSLETLVYIAYNVYGVNKLLSYDLIYSLFCIASIRRYKSIEEDYIASGYGNNQGYINKIRNTGATITSDSLGLSIKGNLEIISGINGDETSKDITQVMAAKKITSKNNFIFVVPRLMQAFCRVQYNMFGTGLAFLDPQQVDHKKVLKPSTAVKVDSELFMFYNGEYTLTSISALSIRRVTRKDDPKRKSFIVPGHNGSVFSYDQVNMLLAYAINKGLNSLKDMFLGTDNYYTTLLQYTI